MEKQSKKIFSILLMAVGVLFISVSGGIFVSRTWQYIPEEVKKLMLLTVTGLFYACAITAERKGNLKITSTALFYLAVFFSGFSTLSVLSMFEISALAQWTIAQLVMMFPVIFHFIKHHSMIDYLFELLLLDGAIVTWTGFNIISKEDNFILSFALVTMAISIAIKYAKDNIFDNSAFIVIGSIAYGIHAFIFLFVSLINSLFTKDPFLFALALALFVGSTTVLYLAYDNTFLRILQSMSILYSIFILNFAIILTFDLDIKSFSYVFFIPFVAGILIQLLLRRPELFWVNVGLSIFYSMIQSVTCMFGYCFGFCDYPIPYAACAGLMLVIWMFITGSENKKSYVKAALIFFCIQGTMVLSYINSDFQEYYCLYLFFALAILIPTVWIDDKDVKAILYTISTAFVALGLAKTPVIPVTFEELNMKYEYGWSIFSIFVVLLTFLWYHRREALKQFQIGFVALMVLPLLLHNFRVQQLPNLMFFGIVTLLMFLLSIVHKNKACSTLTAIALMLVVIYMTKAVWMSIAWWVYLFIAGIGLILLAIKKEKSADKE